jgi:hypothetical protein
LFISNDLQTKARLVKLLQSKFLIDRPLQLLQLQSKFLSNRSIEWHYKRSALFLLLLYYTWPYCLLRSILLTNHKVHSKLLLFYALLYIGDFAGWAYTNFPRLNNMLRTHLFLMVWKHVFGLVSEKL